MKKTSFLMIVLLVALVVMGCGTKKDNTTPVEKNTTTNETSNDTVDEDATSPSTNETKVETADEAADKITELTEVDNATVLVTDHNAYVAVVLKDKAVEEATKELEDKVAEKVRSSNSAIENVYVSLNPDFVERMTDYREKVRAGEPVEGFFDEFSEAMKRVFPDAH
ncbi:MULTISPECIES: YhcN/YlaJ family sporulation lipoprotein [Sporosarcina]|uniref:Sporulation lipoprotein, YhcN/YlaJ family n=2 Tax=Sporosarcina newyorkensis TaxID=759851 RepID=A0A1T4XG74_9BACL|nr:MULTISPECIES: YhcN/YlaJ family sporulation lipoprotein [Sporosarcina]EGQ27705.1 lipoprotein YhcN [Sporosarcina newyorkensis 2681]MBY0220966.1 YhcN/YlaJ family sporulation lipoprotein [Sporosarcina aquimarina]SKA88081.1 sporulation lipoprotein, YhcN/YlaJ family [Sporosarcina newyorkensis]